MLNVLYTVGALAVAADSDVDAFISSYNLTEGQAALIHAVMENERTKAVVDKWWAWCEERGACGSLEMLGAVFSVRSAKAIVDEFWSVYDEERAEGNIQEATDSPWWD